jgi:hypothetical protein
MTDPFAALGKPRRRGADMRCSLCGDPIPDEHVPLLLFANGRDLMWAYCDGCEIVVLDKYKMLPQP